MNTGAEGVSRPVGGIGTGGGVELDAPVTTKLHRLIAEEAGELVAHGIRNASPEALWRHCWVRFGGDITIDDVSTALNIATNRVREVFREQ